MATPEQIRKWVGTTPPTDWYGRCAGLTWQAIRYNGGVSGTPYGSATAAYNAARSAGKIESTDPSKAPAGALHYWSYYGKDYLGNYGNWGHVTLDIYGRGTDTLGATHYAHQVWGVSAGLISVAAQTRGGMGYLGWARTYGSNQRIEITTGSSSGGGSQPFDPEDDMDATDKKIALETRTDVGIIKQLLSETQQWMGLVQMTGEIYKNVGIIKQLISETESWTGMDARISLVLDGVKQLEEQVAKIPTSQAAITDAQIKAIADAVAAQVGTPTANIDYVKIAKDVRAEFAINPLK